MPVRCGLSTEAMLEAEPALGPVLQDLQAQPVDELTLRESDDPAHVVLFAASSGTAVAVPRQAPAVRAREGGVDAVIRLANLVQDAAVEALSAAGVTPVWPRCPRHPAVHPLEAQRVGDRPVWRCPTDKISVAEIGLLPTVS
jgi:hypothetical protein